MVKKYRVITVNCQCGLQLARYRKGGKGRLVKMFLSRIVEDSAEIFLVEPRKALGEDVHCPACKKRVATLQMIRGKVAAKVNRGGVAPI